MRWVARQTTHHPGPLWYKCWPQQTQRADICNNGRAWQHVCGVRASRHQLVFTAQERIFSRRDLSSRLQLKSPLLPSLHLPCVAMWVVILASEESRDWGFITRRGMTGHFVISDVRRDSVACHLGAEEPILITPNWWPSSHLIFDNFAGVRPQSAWHLSSTINLSGWVEKYLKIPTVLQISSSLHQFTHLHLEMWPKNEFSEKNINANLLP